MALLKLMVLNSYNEEIFSSQNKTEVTMAYRGYYQPGDKISIVTDTKGLYLKLRLDDSLDESWVYLTDYQYIFTIPFAQERKPYGVGAFSQERHFAYASIISEAEFMNYHNVAKNSFDTNYNQVLYPHVTTNVKTTNPQFYARNAIDGIFETSNHGSWPHSSWGINQQSNAWLKIDFGAMVEIDKIYLYLRADFPHDNWWHQAKISFSDVTIQEIKLSKTGSRQVIAFTTKKITWLILSNLQMSDEESQFPALSQIMVMGRKINEN